MLLKKKLRFAKVPSNSSSTATVNFCWSFWHSFRRPNDRFGVGVHAAMCRSIGWYGRNTLYHELMNRYLTVLSTMAIICSRTFLIRKLSPKNDQSVPSSFKHLHLRGALIRETTVLWKSVTYSFCAYTHAFIGAVAVMQSWSFLDQQMWGRHACYRDTWQETLLKPFLWVYDEIFSRDSRLQIKRGIDLPCWAQMI